MGGNINNSDDEYEEGTAEQLPPTVNAYDEQLGQKRRKCRTTRSDDALEPVFYQSFKTVALWMEFLRGMCFERVVAFLAADLTLLEACMLLNLPVLGFCFTKVHLNQARERLTRRYLENGQKTKKQKQNKSNHTKKAIKQNMKEMKNPTSSCFSQAYADVAGNTRLSSMKRKRLGDMGESDVESGHEEQEEEEEQDEEKDTPKPKPKPKTKKGKGKKPKADSEEGDDDDDVESGESN